MVFNDNYYFYGNCTDMQQIKPEYWQTTEDCSAYLHPEDNPNAVSLLDET